MMKRTVYLPEQLWERVDAYLKEHPGETFSNLVQSALEVKLASKDASRLLSLAGIVQHTTYPAADHPEDRVTDAPLP